MIDIIPAIDIMDGQCVRLSRGDFETRKTYSNDPLEMALRFADAGIKRLHVVDLDGAKKKSVVNWKTLRHLQNKSGLTIDFGGGIQTTEEVRRVFDLGVPMVTIGSLAAKQPELISNWKSLFGAEKIIIAADFLENEIAVSGWKEKTNLLLESFIGKWKQEGFTKYLCTDISRDGMLKGPAFDVYEELNKGFEGIYLIASGGISNIGDVKLLNKKGIAAVIIGKAYYENRISLKELEPFLC